MKLIRTTIRLLLTGTLLYFVWQENMLAIKIAITLVYIGTEVLGLVLGELCKYKTEIER